MKLPPLSRNAPLLIILATVCYTGMSVCVKTLGTRIPVYETIFFRSGVSFVILGFLLWHRHIPFRARNLPLLMTRSLSGLLAMSCNFYALGRLGLGDVAILGNTFPIFAVILSFIFLDERPTKTLIFWIAIALIGIGLILRPQLDFLNYAGFIALLAGLLSAIVVVSIHQSHETDPSLRIAFYFMSTCTLIAIPIMLQHFVTPSGRQLLLLIGAGLFGTGGQIMMTMAYGLEDVSRLSPLNYFGVVLSFVAGVIFWGELPVTWSLIGSLVVIVCCIQIARMKRPEPIID